uniref:Secreted protein n=1 Tax=Haemonchus placei TaxID=6290 RepID=A0A0N4WAK2_HAEPC
LLFSGRSLAISNATNTAAPEDGPTIRPSPLIKLRAVRKASLADTTSTPVPDVISAVAGKSPQPNSGTEGNSES